MRGRSIISVATSTACLLLVRCGSCAVSNPQQITCGKLCGFAAVHDPPACKRSCLPAATGVGYGQPDAPILLLSLWKPKEKVTVLLSFVPTLVLYFLPFDGLLFEFWLSHKDDDTIENKHNQIAIAGTET